MPQRGLRVPTGLLGLEGNEQGRGDWRGEVETMADTAAGRRNVSGLWPGGGLAHVVGSCPRGVHGRVCVLKSTTARMGGEHTRGRAAARQTDAERVGGEIRVATACDGLHVRAREQARERMNDPALIAPGGMNTMEVTPRLAVVKRRRAQLGRGTERQRAGLEPFPG
jgi:hypothetical protein